jgi:hypothetical protein
MFTTNSSRKWHVERENVKLLAVNLYSTMNKNAENESFAELPDATPDVVNENIENGDAINEGAVNEGMVIENMENETEINEHFANEESSKNGAKLQDTISGLLKIGAKMLFVFAIAFFVALLGTFSHRSGVSYTIPYGIILALLLPLFVSWVIRFHYNRLLSFVFSLLIAVFVYQFSKFTKTDSLLILGTLDDSKPFFYNYAGYIWLYGSFVMSVIPSILPNKLFKIQRQTAE